MVNINEENPKSNYCFFGFFVWAGVVGPCRGFLVLFRVACLFWDCVGWIFMIILSWFVCLGFALCIFFCGFDLLYCFLR